MKLSMLSDLLRDDITLSDLYRIYKEAEEEEEEMAFTDPESSSG